MFKLLCVSPILLAHPILLNSSLQRTQRITDRAGAQRDQALQNRNNALGTGEDKQDPSGDSSELGEPKPCVCMKEKRHVIVTGDSFLQAMEASICQLDLMSQEVCCLPGARIQDVAEGLPELVQPSNYYPFSVLPCRQEQYCQGYPKVYQE